MLIRISLIIAIIAGLAAGAINLSKVRQIITDTRAQRDDYHHKWDDTTQKLNRTTAELNKTKDTLAQTQKDLAQTKKDLNTAVAAEEQLKKQAATLQSNLDKANSELTDAKIELTKYHAAFPTPQQKFFAPGASVCVVITDPPFRKMPIDLYAGLKTDGYGEILRELSGLCAALRESSADELSRWDFVNVGA